MESNRMMMTMDDNARPISETNNCDHKKLLLTKNRSWTHIAGTISSSNNNLNFNNCNNSLAKANSLRISRSNPHVLESLPSNLKLKLPSLQLISSRFNSQMLPTNGNKKLAPLAKAISFTSTGTTNQTISTPTAIRFNAALQRYNKLKFLFKVNTC